VEAILLISREPLNSRKLAQHARLADGTEARTLVRQLNCTYDKTGRAFRVEQIGGGFRLLTRRRFAPWLRRLVHVPPLERLSAPAMETLAVVAYRQPVLRVEIEAIRGVSCGEILRQLMDRDLVRIGGRSDELGRPYLYTTTKRFLQLFGLQRLEELPRAFALRNDSRSTDQVNGVVATSASTDDQQQEQEKSEVSVTLKAHMLVDETFEKVASITAVAPQSGYDEDKCDDQECKEEKKEDDDPDAADEVDGEDAEIDDVEEEIDDAEEDDDAADDDDAEDDDLEDGEWEEVEDDDAEVEDDEEDLDEGWDDDEEWDEDDEEFDDEEDLDDDDDEEEEESDDEEYEEGKEPGDW
jgi:segregation and condensation protein B